MIELLAILTTMLGATALISSDDEKEEIIRPDGSDGSSARDSDDVIEIINKQDEIFGGQGTDLLFGDAGADLIDGLRGDDFVGESDEDNVIEGSVWDNVIEGGTGDDVLEGSDGNDLITDLANTDEFGEERISGGAGDDAIHADSFTSVINGDSGNDLIDARGLGVQADGGTGDDEVHVYAQGVGFFSQADGGEGHDYVEVENGGTGFVGAYGGEGNDILVGRGDTLIHGGEGIDTFIATGPEDSSFVEPSFAAGGTQISDYDPEEDFLLIDVSDLNAELENQNLSFDESNFSKREITGNDGTPITIVEYVEAESDRVFSVASIVGTPEAEFNLDSLVVVELSFETGTPQLVSSISGSLEIWSQNTGWTFETQGAARL